MSNDIKKETDIADTENQEQSNNLKCAFHPYTRSSSKTNNPSQSKTQILKKVTCNFLDLLKKCSNGTFVYKSQFERICLTKPSNPAPNNELDNEEGNLIVYLNDILNNRYLVKELMGQGTFGQVFRCEDLVLQKHPGVDCKVAVKIIKNKKAYLRQAQAEVEILHRINQSDPDDRHHLVRLVEHFYYNNHLCLVFELLSVNLFELIKHNKFQGLSLVVIRVFLNQLLDSISLLHSLKIIHCDLKPENILIKDLHLSSIKLIDFGSACYENHTIYSYIQSRFYRAPEVILGTRYDTAIDCWSLGCILAELFLGLPLFPGVSQYNQICRIVEMMGYPPISMIENGKYASRYFKPRINPLSEKELLEMEEWEDEESKLSIQSFELKTEEEFCLETNTPVKGWKRYFNYTKLPDLIRYYSMKFVSDKSKEEYNRLVFTDFLKGLLQWDPLERWTIKQAKQHPFLTGKPFDFSNGKRFVPEPDMEREHFKRMLEQQKLFLRQQQALYYQQQQQQQQWYGNGSIPSNSNTGYSFGIPIPSMMTENSTTSPRSYYSNSSVTSSSLLGQTPNSLPNSYSNSNTLLHNTALEQRYQQSNLFSGSMGPHSYGSSYGNSYGTPTQNFLNAYQPQQQQYKAKHRTNSISNKNFYKKKGSSSEDLASSSYDSSSGSSPYLGHIPLSTPTNNSNFTSYMMNNNSNNSATTHNKSLLTPRKNKTFVPSKLQNEKDPLDDSFEPLEIHNFESEEEELETSDEQQEQQQETMMTNQFQSSMQISNTKYTSKGIPIQHQQQRVINDHHFYANSIHNSTSTSKEATPTANTTTTGSSKSQEGFVYGFSPNKSPRTTMPQQYNNQNKHRKTSLRKDKG